MEEFMDEISSVNTSNIHYTEEEVVFDVYLVMTYIIICTGLPLTLIAIYAVYSLARSDHVAPVYVINLLISDLIQLCCLIPWVALPEDWRILTSLAFYNFSVMTSICFMVAIALERYLVIAHPLWYRFRRTIKISVMVSIAVWIFSFAFMFPLFFLVDPRVSLIVFGVSLLLPFPLLIFFLSGTLKALSASRVPSDEKRRIMATLVLVLLIYTLLFLPRIICFLAEEVFYNFTFDILSLMFLSLSPLADLTLYVFMKKGAIDKLLSSLCCDRTDSNKASSSVM